MLAPVSHRRATPRRIRYAVGLVAAVLIAVMIPGLSAAAPRAAKDDTNATLRISTTYPPTNLDPTTTASGLNPYTSLVYDRLFTVDVKNNVVPMLATSWKFSPDGKTLTLALRNDVTFHTGTKMDSKAVVDSLMHWKTAPGSLLAKPMAEITSIDAPDPNTVALHLSLADAAVPALLATAAGIVVDPAAFTANTDWKTNPGLVGSGPWVVSKFIPLQSAEFVRAPGKNWDPKAGKIKTIDLEFTTDQNARINAMSTNSADMAYINIGQSINIANLTSTPDYVLHRSPGFLAVTLNMNTARAPFDDPLVRQAVKEAIDPVPIQKNLFAGDCKPATGLYPSVSWAYSPAKDPYPYNLTKAKATLAKSKVPNGFSFNVVTNAGGGNQDAGTAIQAQLAKIGITLNLQPLPSASLTPLIVARDYDALITVASGTADPGGIIYNTFVGGTNLLGPSGTELKAIADEAADPSMSQPNRAKLYGKANQLLADEVYNVWVCNAPNQWLTTSSVKGVDDMVWANIFDPRYLSMSQA
jgi:peptide/nickel transport system substrate-binding protein